MRRVVLPALLLLLSAATALGQVAVRMQFSLRGFGPGQPFREPLAVAFEQSGGTIYIADTGNNRLVAFSAQGFPLYRIDLESPSGIAATRDQLYVASGGKVSGFTRRGEPAAALDLSRAGPQGTLKPGPLASDDEGNVYVADTQGAQVLKFDSRRNFQFRFGGVGDAIGQFKLLAGIAVDQLGRIYASDSLGVPIQIFDRGGRYMTSLGRRGSGPDEFGFPAGLAIDRSGRLWAVDNYRHHVKGFDSGGRFLGTFGSYGMREGELFFPIAIAADQFGRLFVLEKGSSRLQAFQMERP